jgi:hypothetical protein
MQYPKEFFELQYKFALKLSELNKIDLSKALLDYTNIYKLFGIQDWDFDKENPVWLEFLSGLKTTNDVIEYIYNFYLQKFQSHNFSNDEIEYGCFSFDYSPDKKRINIHFENHDNPEPGALSKERMDTRKSELKEMFEVIKTQHPDAEKVYGHSWLYNLHSYTRLFPESYTKDKKVDHNCFRGIGLWGQFINSNKEVRVEMKERFLEKVSKLENSSDAENCFEYLVYETEGRIEDMYGFYEI